MKTSMRFKPMLCGSATAEEILNRGPMNWLGEGPVQSIVEKKVDGVRGVIIDGQLYDRRGVDITERFPEFKGIEKMRGIFDGEILCVSGEFSDVQARMHIKDKFTRALLAKKNPAQFHCFDYLEDGIDDRLLSLRKYRLALLHSQMQDDAMSVEREEGHIAEWFRMLPWFDGLEFEKIWAQASNEGWEGVVVKRMDSEYQIGKRSDDWLKVKLFKETIAEFTKYEDHPKGITIETADGRRVVVNGAQAQEVKRQMKEKGSINAEIQYMPSPQKDSDAWRFPSFRGLQKEVKK